jgi:hypothetical protein
MFCLSDWEILLIHVHLLRKILIVECKLDEHYEVSELLWRSSSFSHTLSEIYKFTLVQLCSVQSCSSRAFQQYQQCSSQVSPKTYFQWWKYSKFTKSIAGQTINITKSWWVHPYSSRAWAWAYSAKYSIQKRLSTHLTVWSLCVGLDSMTKYTHGGMVILQFHFRVFDTNQQKCKQIIVIFV